MQNNIQAWLHREAENAALCQYAGAEYPFAEVWEVLETFPTGLPRFAAEWQACSALDSVEQAKLEREAWENGPPAFIYAEICKEKDIGEVCILALDASYRLWFCALDS